MERFVLAQTEKERERKIRKYEEAGYDDWQIEMLMNEKKDFDKDFGLNHTFKKLNNVEEEQLDFLFEKRMKMLEEYEEVLSQLEKIAKEEQMVREIIQKTNSEICEIEGHRLEQRSEEIIDEDGYGGLMSFGFVRKCYVCGKSINERDIKPEDVVVKPMVEPTEKSKIKTKKIES